MKDDPAYLLILSTLRTLARDGLLDIACDCPDCLQHLAEEVYETLSAFKPVLAA